jgi:hypothetical protein
VEEKIIFESEDRLNIYNLRALNFEHFVTSRVLEYPYEVYSVLELKLVVVVSCSISIISRLAFVYKHLSFVSSTQSLRKTSTVSFIQQRGKEKEKIPAFRL